MSVDTPLDTVRTDECRPVSTLAVVRCNCGWWLDVSEAPDTAVYRLDVHMYGLAAANRLRAAREAVLAQIRALADSDTRGGRR